MYLLDKYKLSKIEDFIGNEKIIKELLDWFDTDIKKTSVILTGPIGCGKTSIIDVICNKFNYDIHYFQSCDITKKILLSSIKPIVNSFFFNKKIIIIDNIEDLSYVSISEINKNTRVPVIFIGTKLFNKLSSKKYLKLHLKCPYKKDLIIYIKNIVINEKINITQNKIKHLVNNNNDIRSLLIYLSDMTFSLKSYSYSNTELVKSIFENSYNDFNSIDDISNIYINSMLFENYINYPIDITDMTSISDSFSISNYTNTNSSPYCINNIIPSYNTNLYNFRNPVLHRDFKSNIMTNFKQNGISLDTLYFLPYILNSKKKINNFQETYDIDITNINNLLINCKINNI